MNNSTQRHKDTIINLNDNDNDNEIFLLKNLCVFVFYYFFHSAEPSRYIHIGRASPLKLNLKIYLKFFSGERGVVSLLNINFKFNFERSDQKNSILIRRIR